MANKKFLIKKGMIISAGLLSAIGIIFNGVAMGTTSWILSEGNLENGSGLNGSIWVNYGLFGGEKQLGGRFGDTFYNLAVFCPKGEGVCLVSCGRNETEQESEFNSLRFGVTPLQDCIPKSGSATKTSDNRKATSQYLVSARAGQATVTSDDQFMDYSLWIATIIFLSFMLAAQVVSAGLCALNAVTVPIETYVGPMGIYIANFTGGLVGLITLSLWGGLYSNNLSEEIGIRETILNEYKMNSTTLGFSYWFVFISLLLTIASSVCIRFRNVLKKLNSKNVSDNIATPGGLIY